MCARPHVPDVPIFRFSETENGNCTEIWHVVRDPLAIGVLQKSRVGYICTCAHAVVPPFPYPQNACAEIWCPVREPLARRFTKV